MLLDYTVDRTGENNEKIRTSFTLRNAESVRMQLDSSSLTVVGYTTDGSYGLLFNDLSLRISAELAKTLVSALSAEIIALEREMTSTSNDD